MIPLEEAERIEGFPNRVTLWRWCKEGKVRAEQVFKGSRSTWLVDVASVRSVLAGVTGNYEKLEAQWVTEQENGFHSGKVISARGVEANKYGLSKFWYYLKQPKSAAFITAENLRLALSNVPVNYKTKNCHYSQRDQMYKSVVSFYKFLTRNGLQALNEDFKKYKPARVFPPKKKVIRSDSFLKLLKTNDAHKKGGRRKFDQELTRTLIMLAGMTGLRRQELINLQVDHIDILNKELIVIDGKGHKNRGIGLEPELIKQIEIYMRVRPETSHPNFLVTKKGTPFDKGGIYRKLRRIADEAGVTIDLHGLRRSFTTINVESGMPLPIAQMLLGHTDIKTTMKYIMVDERTAIDYLKDRKGNRKK